MGKGRLVEAVRAPSRTCRAAGPVAPGARESVSPGAGLIHPAGPRGATRGCHPTVKDHMKGVSR